MPSQKARIIIDTNLWISFLVSNDYSKLDRILSDKKVTLLYSQELIDEFIEVATRPKFGKYFTPLDLQNLVLTLSTRSIFMEVSSAINICRDAKDNFLLALAKDGKATHLITGDKDLLTLKVFHKARILTLTEYLREI
ncbi:MAG TPA: putative toxin-antitoxin system toxin component, PIN family [Chitinophagaceae bacterium]|jgi:hypothetical protein